MLAGIIISEIIETVKGYFYILFYFIWTSAYSYIIFTKELEFYLNPNFNIFSYIFLIFMIFLLINSLVNIKDYSKKEFKKKYLVFFLFLGLAVIFRPEPLSSNLAKKKAGLKRIRSQKRSNTVYSNKIDIVLDSVSINQEKEIQSAKKEENNMNREKFSDAKNAADIVLNKQNTERNFDESASENVENMLILNEKNYFYYLNEFYPKNNYGEFLEKEIKFQGLYIEDSDFFYDNQGIIGRMVITCCIADAIFGGFFVEFSDEVKLKHNNWYSITGKIIESKNKQDYNAFVRIINYKEIEPIKPGYIYPVYELTN